MNLSQIQIVELNNYISRTGVKYTDVRMEILDHVASLVEDLMNANPDLTFEDAIKQAKASFGIFGFGALEAEIIGGINRKYSKVFWEQFLTFFKLKYIGLVFIFAFLFYYGQLLISDFNKVMIGFLLIAFTSLGVMFVVKLRLKRTKNFLSQTTSMSYLTHISLFCLIIHGVLNHIIFTTIYEINLNYALISMVLVFYFIYFTSSVKTALQGVRETEELAAKYRQLNW